MTVMPASPDERVAAAAAAAAAAATSVQITLASPPGAEELLLDPGAGASLCFDYINNGSCTRLRTGGACKYRHLSRTHPDVIADRIRQGKLNPAAAAQLLAQEEEGEEEEEEVRRRSRRR